MIRKVDNIGGKIVYSAGKVESSDLAAGILNVYHVHMQNNASDSWHIVHNLNKIITSFIIEDSAGTRVGGMDRKGDDELNEFYIDFTFPISGKVYYN